jgi:hypothetical protein
LSEKVLGIIRVIKPAFGRTFNENLFFTPDKVIVARTSGTGGVGILFGAVGGAIQGYMSEANREVID